MERNILGTCSIASKGIDDPCYYMVTLLDVNNSSHCHVQDSARALISTPVNHRKQRCSSPVVTAQDCCNNDLLRTTRLSLSLCEVPMHCSGIVMSLDSEGSDCWPTNRLLISQVG